MCCSVPVVSERRLAKDSDIYYVHAIVHDECGNAVDERVFFDGEKECFETYLNMYGEQSKLDEYLKMFKNVKLLP